MAIVLIALDQWLKSSFPVTLNQGVSFGVFSWMNPVLMTILLGALLCVLGGAALRYTLSTRAWWWSVVLLAGGASNLFDRWKWGGVRDLWFIPGTSIQNNLADWLLFLGVLGMIATLWKKERST